MANIKSILDTIRANASQEYQERVPEATQTSIEAVGAPLLTYTALANEFVTALVNRIAFSIIRNKVFSNPLKALKKGSVPLGSDIQEIFTNMAADQGLDFKGDKLLTKTTPDVKTLYHRLNRNGQYPCTITRAMLQTAFISEGAMNQFMETIINSMYSGDEMDEFILVKNLFASGVADSKITTATVSHIKDEATAKAFVKDVKKASAAMEFPSSNFNCYYENRPASDKGKPVVTWTPLENQILIIRADVLVDIGVDVLAAAFNMDQVTFKSRVIKVDSFGTGTNIVAILADEAVTQVYDNLFELTNFFNAQGLYWNYWLNHIQTYSLSLFANAIAFICNDEAISLNPETLSLNNTTPSTITATVTPSGATVTWISSDPTVATVDADGKVTAKADGTCKIFAINGDETAVCTVTVDLP